MTWRQSSQGISRNGVDPRNVQVSAPEGLIFFALILRYEWYRNGQPLELIYNIEMSDTDGTLTIDPATSLDEGYYQCRATNEHGVALTIDTHLQRAGKLAIRTQRRHHDDVIKIDTFSALLAICAGNSPVTGEFLAQRPVTRSFDVFFDLRLNKQLRKQW